eukprot:CAMPEP_0198371262 /NCGR_PEP_ID=MMETSP1450-20131203/157139_1 /TAXON_ID=753684 ORGANISM="Madagascaria erythrocladiodes, Strain CCMP3234" /NCGR_SAMPLE_ID=MMETSP1450 /ASSEMBLY_ACC=CAM_ASM_001115 /LENGTH=84 /DNA_ID=CAMNT_0044078823 /DNA_START=80 /DNA_END=334 /DNA_ORIENTATION=+
MTQITRVASQVAVNVLCVAVQVAKRCEPHAAQAAVERTTFFVEASDMGFKNSPASKRLPAHRAAIEPRSLAVLFRPVDFLHNAA